MKWVNWGGVTGIIALLTFVGGIIINYTTTQAKASETLSRVNEVRMETVQQETRINATERDVAVLGERVDQNGEIIRGFNVQLQTIIETLAVIRADIARLQTRINSLGDG